MHTNSFGLKRLFIALLKLLYTAVSKACVVAFVASEALAVSLSQNVIGKNNILCKSCYFSSPCVVSRHFSCLDSDGYSAVCWASFTIFDQIPHIVERKIRSQSRVCSLPCFFKLWNTSRSLSFHVVCLLEQKRSLGLCHTWNHMKLFAGVGAWRMKR